MRDGQPTDADVLAYLEGEHGPPHPEVVAIIQDALDRALRAVRGDTEWSGEARCECGVTKVNGTCPVKRVFRPEVGGDTE